MWEFFFHPANFRTWGRRFFLAPWGRVAKCDINGTSTAWGVSPVLKLVNISLFVIFITVLAGLWQKGASPWEIQGCAELLGCTWDLLWRKQEARYDPLKPEWGHKGRGGPQPGPRQPGWGR